MPQQQGGKADQKAAKEYNKLVQQTKPKPPVLKNSFWAFVVGGIICTIGQGLNNLFKANGVSQTNAVTATAVVLVFSSALLTGLGVYDNIGKLGGAGSIVPITGFANAMVAPALEFKREGMIFGVAARLFSIAGPVLVFGYVTAWLIGLATIILHR
ncbi:MAG TPA: stage V sporulation protein AC [Bacillota bacterium]|nr:stage V sporulation protein AC [Bacillota bacterium]